MKKEDLRLLIGYGEGYYSGSSEQWAVAFNINDYEMLKERVKEFDDDYIPYFAELDGKHSEVKGETFIEDDIISVVMEYNMSDYDHFNNSIKYSLEKDSEEYLALKKAQDFIKTLKIKETYIHKETGEELNINDYKIEKVVVEQ